MADNKAQKLMDEVKKVLNEYNGVSAEYGDIYGEDSGASEADKERFKETHYVMSTDSKDCHKITAINKEDGSLYVEIDGKEIVTANDLMTALPQNIALRETIAEHTDIDLYANFRTQCENYANKAYERDKKSGETLCCLQFPNAEGSSEKICEIYTMMQKRGLIPHDFQLSDNSSASAYIVLPNVYALGDLNDGSLMEFKNLLMDLSSDPRYTEFEIVSKKDTSYEQYKAKTIEQTINKLFDPDINPRGLLADINTEYISYILENASVGAAAAGGCTLNHNDFGERHKDILKFLNSHQPEDMWNNQDVAKHLKECADKVSAECPDINRESLIHLFSSVDMKQIKDTAGLRMLQVSFKISDSEIEEAQIKYLRRGGYDKWKEDRKKAIDFALQDKEYLTVTVASLMQDEANKKMLDAELSEIVQELEDKGHLFGVLKGSKLAPYFETMGKVYEFDTSCADVREALKEKLKDPKTFIHTQSYEEQRAGEQAIKMLETIIKTETEEINRVAPAKDSKFKPLPPFKPLDPPNIDVYLAKAAALYDKENKLGMTAIKFEDKFKDVIQNARTLQNTQNQNYRFKERVLHFVQKMADKDAAKLFYDNAEAKIQEMLCKFPKLFDKSVELASDVAKKVYEGLTPPVIQKGLEPVTDKITEKTQEAVGGLTDKVSEALILSHKKAQEDQVQYKVNETIKNCLVKLTNHAAHLALKIAKRDHTKVPVNGSPEEIRQARENIRAAQAEHDNIDAGSLRAAQAPMKKVVAWSKSVTGELANVAKASVTATKEAAKTMAKTFNDVRKENNGTER